MRLTPQTKRSAAPEDLDTTQNAYVKLRRFLVEDSLVAVVSLPAGVFKTRS